MEISKFEIVGAEVREYTVKFFSGSGHVIVPKRYVGKKVKIVFPSLPDVPSKAAKKRA